MTAAIATFTGRMIDVTDPRPDDIDLGDVAHALALTCRWSGHVTRFYSIAEHSVRVSYEAEALARELELETGLVRRVALEGLMHDAEEAYPPGDIAAPFKVHPLAEPLVEAAERIRAAVCSRFGLLDDLPDLVHQADRVMLATEARDLVASDWMPPDAKPQAHAIEHTWSPDVAELAFLLRFQALTDEPVLPTLRRVLPERWRVPPSPAPFNRYPDPYPRADGLIIRMMLDELGVLT